MSEKRQKLYIYIYVHIVNLGVKFEEIFFHREGKPKSITIARRDSICGTQRRNGDNKIYFIAVVIIESYGLSFATMVMVAVVVVVVVVSGKRDGNVMAIA